MSTQCGDRERKGVKAHDGVSEEIKEGKNEGMKEERNKQGNKINEYCSNGFREATGERESLINWHPGEQTV